MQVKSSTVELTEEERRVLKIELIGEKSCTAMDFQRRAIKTFGPAAKQKALTSRSFPIS
jgi:hypothetical protein